VRTHIKKKALPVNEPGVSADDEFPKEP